VPGEGEAETRRRRAPRDGDALRAGPDAAPDDPAERIRVGISTCLAGEPVRYDGGHKRDAFLVEELGPWVEWVPVCPEVELGLGVPRDPIRLVGALEAPRLVVERTGEDLTARMRGYAEARVSALARLGLDGYVLKRASPSCGMERVKVHGESGRPVAAGRGLYAAVLMERLPLLPVEEEGRLTDAGIRENFIERVFAAARWRRFRARRPRPGALVAFHAAQKFAVLAHSPTHYARLGRLVAAAGRGRYPSCSTSTPRSSPPRSPCGPPAGGTPTRSSTCPASSPIGSTRATTLSSPPSSRTTVEGSCRSWCR